MKIFGKLWCKLFGHKWNGWKLQIRNYDTRKDKELNICWRCDTRKTRFVNIKEKK